MDDADSLYYYSFMVQYALVQLLPDYAVTLCVHDQLIVPGHTDFPSKRFGHSSIEVP